MLEQELQRRREQNLSAPRVPVSAVAPSIRSFAQAIDRQRQSVERVPLLRASRQALAQVCAALDQAEVAAIAISVDDPAAELAAMTAAALAVGVPVLRADLIVEEFQVYQSRAAGADAVLLHASLLPAERLVRLCAAARSTHMAPCVACATADQVAQAVAAKAEVLAFYAGVDGRPSAALLGALPRRLMALVLPDGASPVEAASLIGRADALLDPALGESADAAADFRRQLEE